MDGFFQQPWFWPSLLVIFGLPLVLVILSEWHSQLVRIGSRAARIVQLLRDYVMPVAALWLLLTQTGQWDVDQAGPKLAATVFAFLVILVLLNTVNFIVFTSAKSGSWRRRIPTIFVEMVRLLVIVVAAAILLGVVWGADVGGLFTALGVGSIVIGLALQNAVGGVISGLLLLFEQPFAIGDWIVTEEGKGCVVEVNWRAVHLDTGNGTRVVPNSRLAEQTFVNLSRATSPYCANLRVLFGTDDPPDRVIAVLLQVAADLPALAPGEQASAVPLTKARYEVSIPLANPGLEWSAVGLFRSRLWFAARRAGLHLDRDETIPFVTDAVARRMMERAVPILRLQPEDKLEFFESIVVEQFQAGETIQHSGTIPDGVRIVAGGVAAMSMVLPDGTWHHVLNLVDGDLIGLTAVTGQAIAATVRAETDVTALFVPTEHLDLQVRRDPELARDFGREIDRRRDAVAAVFKRTGVEVPSHSALIAF